MSKLNDRIRFAGRRPLKTASGSVKVDLANALFSELNRMLDEAGKEGYDIQIHAGATRVGRPRFMVAVLTPGETATDRKVFTGDGDGIVVVVANVLREAIEWHIGQR